MPRKRVFPTLAVAFTAFILVAGCGSTQGGGRRAQSVDSTVPPPPSGGIPPDKQAEIELLLQQREVSTRRCYQDVLNEKQDRNFAGTVKVLIDLDTNGQARSVKVVGGTLNDVEVQTCLVNTIGSFEFPTLEHGGEAQYEFQFRPLY